MVHRLKVRSFFTLNLLALLLAWLMADARAAPPASWKERTYTYYADHIELHRVLNDFSNTYGVKLRLAGRLQGDMHGQMHNVSAVDFLDWLGNNYKFRWFLYNDTLYINSLDENTVARIPLSEKTDDFRSALTGVGLYEPKFGWGDLPGQNAVIVDGPRAYVQLVRQFAASSKKPPSAEAPSVDTMVFPLKYADAADGPDQARGIASLLRRLFNGKPEAAEGTSTDLGSALSQAASRAGAAESALRASQDASTPDLPPLPSWPVTSDLIPGQPRLLSRGAPNRLINSLLQDTSSSHGEDTRPVIEAYEQRNLVVIRGDVSHREEYANVIKAADVPRPLIDAEMFVVEVNRTHHAVDGNKPDWNALPSTENWTGQLLADVDYLRASTFGIAGLGIVRLASHASVVTMDNQPATLELKQTMPAPPTGASEAKPPPLAIGFKTKVTPRIADANQGVIRVSFDMEGGERGPRRSLITQTLLHDGQAALVGSYTDPETPLSEFLVIARAKRVRNTSAVAAQPGLTAEPVTYLK
jgi:type III secretion protein C